MFEYRGFDWAKIFGSTCVVIAFGAIAFGVRVCTLGAMQFMPFERVREWHDANIVDRMVRGEP